MAATNPEEALSPKKAKSYFAFFRKVNRAQVILLGDCTRVSLHYLRPENRLERRYVLCSKDPKGPENCRWCGERANDPTIHAASFRYYFPALQRSGRSGKKWVYRQIIAVFTEAALDQLNSTIKTKKGLRGCRLEVTHGGASTKYVIKKLPKIQEAVCPLPAAFSIAPFIRALYGIPQDPTQPLEFFNRIRISTFSAPVIHPEPLKFTQEEYLAAVAYQARLLPPAATSAHKPAE